MESAYLISGMAVGIIIGKEYYKYQIVKKKNQTVIAEVKKWLTDAEKSE